VTRFLAKKDKQTLILILGRLVDKLVVNLSSMDLHALTVLAMAASATE
jgi:hypothetical protein